MERIRSGGKHNTASIAFVVQEFNERLRCGRMHLGLLIGIVHNLE